MAGAKKAFTEKVKAGCPRPSGPNGRLLAQRNQGEMLEAAHESEKVMKKSRAAAEATNGRRAARSSGGTKHDENAN